MLDFPLLCCQRWDSNRFGGEIPVEKKIIFRKESFVCGRPEADCSRPEGCIEVWEMGIVHLGEGVLY